MLSRRSVLLMSLGLLAPDLALAQAGGIWSDKALDQHKFPAGAGPESLQRKSEADRRERSSGSASQPAQRSVSPSAPSAPSSGGVRRAEMPPRPEGVRKVEMPARPEVRKIEGPKRAGM